MYIIKITLDDGPPQTLQIFSHRPAARTELLKYADKYFASMNNPNTKIRPTRRITENSVWLRSYDPTETIFLQLICSVRVKI